MESDDIKEMIKIYERPDAPFPWEFIKKMADAGVCGINIPQEYGGAGMDNLSGVIAEAEIARILPSFALIISVGCTLVSAPLDHFGTEEQKSRWLPDIAAGKIVGAFGLTEANAGSDTAGISTRAECRSEGWLINGSKRFITCGPHAAFVVLIVKTSVGPTAFVIPCDRSDKSGFESLPPEHKEGQHAAHMGELVFTNYFVPRDAVLGKVALGDFVRKFTLDHGRPWIGAQAIGILERTLKLAAERASDRFTFGQRLNAHSSIYDVITELALALDVSRLLVWHAAILEDQGKESGPHASLAKLFASEEVTRLTVKATKIFGGQGYLYNEEINRLKRDAAVINTYEGTSAMQCYIILQAWFEGKLKFQPPPHFNTRLDELRQDVINKLGRQNVLKAGNQRLPFRAAHILPLMEAWRLSCEEYPKELMAIGDTAILQELLLERIKKEFPKKSGGKKDSLWDKAFKSVRI